ncbi:MAG: hypothetical protein ACK5Q5_19365 [Planctomycetaceae bacterium]
MLLDTRPAERFVEQLPWREDDFHSLRTAARSGDADRFARQLVRRGLPRLRRLPAGVSSTCQLLVDLLTADAFDAVEHLTRETLMAVNRDSSRKELKNHVTALLDAAEEEAAVSPAVLAAWLGLLSPLPQRIEPALYSRLWCRTLAETLRFTGAQLETDADPTGVSAELQDEILFRASIVFAPLALADNWRQAATENWRGRLAQAGTDAPWPPLQGQAWLTWIRSLIRVVTDAAREDLPLWKKRHRSQLQLLAAELAALLLPNGQLLGRRPTESGWGPEIANLVRLTGWDRESSPARQVAMLTFTARKQRRADKAPGGKPRRPSFQSDVGMTALLRRDWNIESDGLFVDYAGRTPVLQLYLDGQLFLAGSWESTVSVNGESREIGRDWRCECWASDRDADYLEFSVSLGRDLRLMRQVLFGRRERMLLLAEAVRGASPDAVVQLQSTIPVCPDIAVEADGTTRELQARLDRRRVRLLPMLLPWERSAGGPGRIDAVASELVQQTEQTGPVCQALLLDWEHKPATEPAEAVPLRIAEDGQHLPARDAVGARARVGNRQWLYWHNFTASPIPRTCLGHHSSYETIIARIKKNGDADILVHVEGAQPEATK